MDFASIGQTIFSGLANGALYAFIGLGFGLVNRSTGIINFAQGDLAMLGAILTAVLSDAGLPLPAAVPLAVLACGALSGGFYLLGIRQAQLATMSQRIIITIGFSILLRGAVTSIWGTNPMLVPPFTGGRPFDVLGVSILPQQLWLIGTLAAVSVGVALFFRHTTIGLALRAGAVNPLGASFMGIDHRQLGFYAFVAAGLLGGLGGAVWSPIAFAQVDIGVGLGLKGFTAAALGGFSVAYGPIAGGFLFGLIEASAAGFISSAWQEAIAFGLLLMVLLFRPQGLLGKARARSADDAPEEVLGAGATPTRLARTDAIRLVCGTAALLGVGMVLGGSWITSAIFAGIVAIVVMGLVLLTGYAGQLSLGQGAFMMIGAYASGYLTLSMGWPPLAALLAGVVLAVVVALALGRLIFRLRGYALSMASLGLLMIALTLARELSSITGGPNGLPGIPPFSLLGVTFFTDPMMYGLVVAFSVIVLVLGLSITRSRFGRALLAIRSNESAARACGADVVQLKIGSFAFSAGAASVAGSLYVHYLGIANPLPFNADATIIQLTALTLGGFLSLWGAYVGAAIVVALPSLIGLVAGSSETQASAGLQYTCFGLLLICVVVAQSNVPLRLAMARLPRARMLRNPVRQA